MKCPPYRRLRYAIDLSKLGHCLTLGIAIGSDTDHFLVQLAFAAERDALALGSLNALFAALADQATLELVTSALSEHATFLLGEVLSLANAAAQGAMQEIG